MMNTIDMMKICGNNKSTNNMMNIYNNMMNTNTMNICSNTMYIRNTMNTDNKNNKPKKCPLQWIMWQ